MRVVKSFYAEQGHTDAQYRLGELYYVGQGGVQDYVEAWKWYLKAAEQGYAEAQYGLGRLYHGPSSWINLFSSEGTDHGVPQDHVEGQ